VGIGINEVRDITVRRMRTFVNKQLCAITEGVSGQVLEVLWKRQGQQSGAGSRRNDLHIAVL